MTGERILYIVLIAVAIGIGIYGFMNNLFRPHVYYVCQYEGPESPIYSKDFYLNERENYVVVDGFQKYQYESQLQSATRYVKRYPEGNTSYILHNRNRNSWMVDDGGLYFDRFIDCKVTRQFLQRN